MENPLRIAVGMGMFFLLLIGIGTLSYWVVGSFLSALALLFIGGLMFWYGAHKESILPFMSALSMGIGAATGLVSTQFSMGIGFPVFLALFFYAMIGLVCLIIMAVVSTGILSRHHVMYEDGRVDALFLQLSSIFDGLGDKLVTLVNMGRAKLDDTFVSNEQAKALNDKIAALEARVADLEATASAAQQKKLDALRAERTEG